MWERKINKMLMKTKDMVNMVLRIMDVDMVREYDPVDLVAQEIHPLLADARLLVHHINVDEQSGEKSKGLVVGAWRGVLVPEDLLQTMFQTLEIYL